METPNGLKAVMPVLSEGQKTNKYLVAALRSYQTPYATPDPHITVVKALAPGAGPVLARTLVDIRPSFIGA